MKSGVLAFGVMIWAAPVGAQVSADPLAPLPNAAAPPQVPPRAPVQSGLDQPTPAVPQLQQPIVVTQSAPLPRAVVVPTNWRGVFDAIDAGQWASARAGIAALPCSVLTPVAKAEL